MTQYSTTDSPTNHTNNRHSAIKRSTEIVIIGSGFSGSIMALVLAQIGYRVTVVDQCKHPRFAIGESSTPIADSYLRELSETFSIPELLPLATFSSARNAYPDLTIGRKRGFSYFWHQTEKEFDAGPNHENELVVAASSSDELADSHWMRSDVDSFFVSLFEKYGVNFFDEATVMKISRSAERWRIECDRTQSTGEPAVPMTIETDFLIDASGGSGVVMQQLGIGRSSSSLKTNTSVLFAHFEGMTRWKDLVDPASAKDHPFVCDDAAVHQVFDFGWMWQLRFDNGITSCGFSIPSNSRISIRDDANRMKTFQSIISHYPTLKKQFAEAKCVAPESGPIFRSRIQHLADAGSGPGWCALPNTIGFVDPLHSKGIAHSLSGIIRLGKLFQLEFKRGEFQRGKSPMELSESCKRLTEQFRHEVKFIDRLVSICYRSLFDFRLFRLATFWYFAAATNFEKRRAERPDHGSQNELEPFLFSDHLGFDEALSEYESLLDRHDLKCCDREPLIAKISNAAERLLAPFDHVNLFSPSIHNMYAKTAAPEKQ